MSTLDKFISFMSINNENDEAGDEYDDEYDTEEEPYAPRRKGAAQPPRREEEEELSEYGEERIPRRITPKATPFRSKKTVKENTMSTSNMEVFVLKPTSLDDASQAVDALLDGRSVVLNLDNMINNKETMPNAQRVFDFVKGATYALNGRMESISNYVFIITPETTNISGDISDNASDDIHISDSGNLF